MDDISILITGQAGQGIQTVETLLADIFLGQGYHVFATKEYMSRVRGGSNSTGLRVSSRPVRACTDRIDILLALDREILKRISDRISASTLVIGETGQCRRGIMENVDFRAIASKIGNPVFSNVVATGVILSLLEIDPAVPSRHMESVFGRKGADIVGKNLKALEEGYREGAGIKGRISPPVPDRPDGKRKGILVNGSQAIGMGAIAGGCDFISAYPMSPSTGVFTYLAGKGREESIVTEQAEDEISAINMVLGASYAGARAMANTSGGGFALMEEGVSLAGMAEIPVVIHIAQRPGPATGLPTRTEQGDLNLALYSGHGEFPRVILAPGTIEEGISLSKRAFDLASSYQSPVFILTDQYYLDSYYDVASLPVIEKKAYGEGVVRTKKGYKRYLLTENGISPRGIPGYGEGLVRIDSDEHDEDGFITEDMDTRKRMVEKRWKKLDAMKIEAPEPGFFGDREYRILLVGWGSTYHIIREAMEKTGIRGLGFLHFSQLYPLGGEVIKYLEKAEKVIGIENNLTGQFADLIARETGFRIGRRITKYNGLPFSVEEMKELLLKEIK